MPASSYITAGYTNYTETHKRIFMFIKLLSLGKIVKYRCVQTGLRTLSSELLARQSWECTLGYRCCVPPTGSVPC